MGNYVKGRLKERSCPEAVIRSFADLYGDHRDLFLVQKVDDIDEVAVYFATAPEWFKGWIDIDSPDDPYDETMWAAFRNYLQEGVHAFAGGRYGMARELVAKQPPLDFFEPYTLGQVCHIVQLSINPRKIVAYHKKMLKPMNQSTHLPITTEGGDKEPEGSADIQDMPELMRVLFKTTANNPDACRLDRMKQIIKDECGVRLNEMVFRCTKLIEVFRLPPLNIAFRLENDGKVFFLKQNGSRQDWPEEVRKAFDDSGI